MVVISPVRRAAVSALAIVLAVGFAVAPATANTAAAVPPFCTSEVFPAYAEYMNRAVAAAQTASGGVTISFYDRKTDTMCFTNALREFKTASIVKVLIAVAAELRAQQEGRPLDDRERALVEPMIVSSDNDATIQLWSELHLNGPQLEQARVTTGMAYTRPGPSGDFGSTITTAQDQLSLLIWLTTPSENALERSRRDNILALMSRVVITQRYGVPVGAPIGATWHNKIGYAHLGDGRTEYRTHSIGAVRGTAWNAEHDYMMALLSDGNLPFTGIGRVSAAAATLNQAKNAWPGN